MEGQNIAFLFLSRAKLKFLTTYSFHEPEPGKGFWEEDARFALPEYQWGEFKNRIDFLTNSRNQWDGGRPEKAHLMTHRRFSNADD
jgi:hypothetical protein